MSGSKTFSLKFVSREQTIAEHEIPIADRPSDGVGEPGSVLDLALALGVEIDHACGGVNACSTCHVIVRQGLGSCSSPSEDEEDQLDEAPGLTPQSRLACQCVPDGSQPLVVEIPSWNRNRVREGAIPSSPLAGQD